MRQQRRVPPSALGAPIPLPEKPPSEMDKRSGAVIKHIRDIYGDRPGLPTIADEVPLPVAIAFNELDLACEERPQACAACRWGRRQHATCIFFG
jgi:hypothetical protein